MHEAGAVPLVIESPAGRADLIVDGTLPLGQLAVALLLATGMLADAAARRQPWQFWEGQRRLDPSRSLVELGVVAGSELRLT